MAHEIKLEVYNIKLHKKNSKEEIDLGSFFEGKDIFKFFQNYVKDFDSLQDVENQKKTMMIQEKSLTINKLKRHIYGIMECGSYGIESEIVDRKTGDKKYNKRKDDSDIMPFYFLIKIPVEGNVGFLILERKSNLGIGTVIREHFNDYFSHWYKDYSVSFSPQVSKGLYKKFLKDGKVQTITLRRLGLPKDLADRTNITNLTESLYTVEIRFKAKKKPVFQF